MLNVIGLIDYFVNVVGLSEYEAVKATDLFICKFDNQYEGVIINV